MPRKPGNAPPTSTVKTLVLPLFFISGATGLIYEVTWTRTFGGVFGNTVSAISTVLTAFMLGLAVGSWLFGRLADRTEHPLRLYAFLELRIGSVRLCSRAFSGRPTSFIVGSSAAFILRFSP